MVQMSLQGFINVRQFYLFNKSNYYSRVLILGVQLRKAFIWMLQDLCLKMESTCLNLAAHLAKCCLISWKRWNDEQRERNRDKIDKLKWEEKGTKRDRRKVLGMEQKWKLDSIFYLVIENDSLDKAFSEEQTAAWAATKVNEHSCSGGDLKQPAILH